MPGAVDKPRIAAAVHELLAAIGVDPHSKELSNTPTRVADAYAEFFAGVSVNPADFLRDALPIGEDTGELVLLRDIALRSMCEHHLLPFRGRAHIAYQPDRSVVGLSALPRVVETLAARPQVQERLGEQIAHTLNETLAPKGVIVVLEASHGCLADRGLRQSDAVTLTVASRGTLSEVNAQASVFALLQQSGNTRS